MLRKILRPFFAALLLGVAQSAGAAELGGIVSVSRVGSALRIEIELASVEASFPRQSNCFTLASDPSNPEGLPVLANGRATLRTLDGRHSVIINSNQRLGEAAVLGLRLGCGINAARDYRLQLPPEAPVPVDVPLAAPTFPQAAPRPVAAPRPPRKPLPPRPRKAVDRVELSLSPADEALARSLAQPLPAAAKPPASGPADYAAAGAVATQLDAQLRELEATVAKLRAEIESSNLAQARGPAAAGDALATTVPAAAADGGRAAVPRSLRPATREDSDFPTDWLPAVLAGGGVLALAAFAGRLWWRRRAAARADAEAKQRLAARQQAASAGTSVSEGEAHGAPAAHKIDVVEPKSPLELADFLLSFGKVDDAAMALEEHIAGNPRGAIEPWRKLLDVYRQVGRRHAFEALARRMEKTFKVPAPPW